VPVVFEKLASQLHEPPFRTAEAGYDQADVDGFLSEVAARLNVLEARVAAAEQRAEVAEASLARARWRAGQESGATVESPVPSGAELAGAIRAGERRADEVRAEAARRVEQVRADAEARVVEFHRDAKLPDLRTRMALLRDEAAVITARRDAARESMDAAMAAVTSARGQILGGIDAALVDLKEAPR